ncbi:MAG: peptide/nickel transport system substrate-binding protein [Solirubrobacteraceae bacterium]|jgi:peptide/nickel transport system substrate-binding protein|nr:peptide/nickel transport system substrate-binding protein [Solirubrobacteraceae bacterium]
MGDRETLDELLGASDRGGLTRREAVQRLGLGFGVLSTAGWLAACGGSDTKKKATAKKGGTLIVGAEEDGYTLTGSEAGIGLYPLNANIFEGLVRMDPYYGIVPVLARSWTVKDNTWRFELRRDVKFHDGRPFTAEAVRHTFERIAGLGGGTPGFAKKGTKVVDDYTVEVTPQFPNLRLVEQIVHPEYSILAPGTDPVKQQIGTGPFRFASYKRQQEIVVDRFPGYWSTPAILDHIQFKFLPEANARRLALEGGEVGLILGVPNETATSLRRKGFDVHVSPAGAYEAMYANIGGRKGYTLLQDSAVRHAIEYAIDRNALISGIYGGQAHAEQTMIPARVLGSHATEVKGYTYDTAMASKLLDDAGWTASGGGIRSKGGKRLQLELISGFPSAATHTGVPEFVQDQLKRVGIGVKIVKTPDDAAYSARTASLQGDLWLERGNQNDANPSFLPALLFSKKGLFGPGDYQKMFAPGGAFDRLINKALSAPTDDEVQSLTAQAMAALIDDDAIVIPLAGISQISASKNVTGFAPHSSALQVRYDRVALSA